MISVSSRWLRSFSHRISLILQEKSNLKIQNEPLYTDGYYKTEYDIQNQIVGASKTGAVVRLGDIADFTRDYAEPDSKITVNGKKAILAGNPDA